MEKAEENYSIYALRCSDGSLYTGSSPEDKDSYARRHNDGKGVPYTKGRLPVSLFWMHAGIKNRWIASATVFAIRRLYPYQKKKLFKGDKEILNYVISEGIENSPVRENNYKKYLAY